MDEAKRHSLMLQIFMKENGFHLNEHGDRVFAVLTISFRFLIQCI